MRASLRLAMLVPLVSLSPCIAHAGYLDPAGPPGSDVARMPTLTQIEPRQVVDSLPCVISNSGPYVVTRNLTGVAGTNGITIQAGSVTLDLNGFALRGVASSKSGIAVSGAQTFIVVRNGVLSGWGQCGMDGAAANNSKIENLLVSSNGLDGVRLGTNSTITRCAAVANASDGFDAREVCVIAESTAQGNTGIGFKTSAGCVLQNCVADHNGSDGFQAESVGQISRCTASDNGNAGFSVSNCCSVLDSCSYGNWTGFFGWDGIVFSRCVAYSNTYGFYAAMSCSFSDSSAYSNTWQGFYGDVGCSVQNCTAYKNYDGIGARNGSKVVSSSSCQNKGNGFWIGHSTTLEACSAMANSNGVSSQAGSHIYKNTFRNNTGAGIHATSDCRIENNHLMGCGTGIELTGSDNILSGNTLVGNAMDYDMVAGNQLDLVVSHIPVTISWPAKVKLSGTLTGANTYSGISIATNDVTVDLDGHALVGVPGSRNGVLVSAGLANVEIKNGTIRGWDMWGIDASKANSMKVSNIRACTNGSSVTYGGINLGSNAVVTECSAVGNAGAGIAVNNGSRVRDSTFSENGTRGLSAQRGGTISGCSAVKNGTDGIYGYWGCTISHCSAYENGDDGIEVYYACTVESCSCSMNTDGIHAYSDNHIMKNACDSNGLGGSGYGINAASVDNTLDGNSLTDNDTGICAPGGSLIIRNRATGNATNYSISASCTYGPFVTGTGVITNVNPWANLEF